MKNTYQAVETALQTARRNSDSFGVRVLSTLLGEMQNKIPKNVEGDARDTQAQAIVKKFIESVGETYKLTTDADRRRELSLEEIMLAEFMPKQLNDNELAFVITAIIGDVGANKGAVMKSLKARYPNQYDGKKAAELVDRAVSA